MSDRIERAHTTWALRAALYSTFAGDDISGWRVKVTDVRPKGCWVISGAGAGRRLHLVDRAYAAWRDGEVRLGASAICGATSVCPEFPIDPEGLGAELCDNCALGDQMGPVVYRFLDATGRALYIGSTSNILARLASHAGSPRAQIWLRQTDRLDVQSCPTRADALAAEVRAIVAERPPFNVQYKVPVNV